MRPGRQERANLGQPAGPIVRPNRADLLHHQLHHPARHRLLKKGPWEGPLHPPRRVSSGKAQRHSRDQLLKEKDPGRVLYIPREECRRAKPNDTHEINYSKKRTLGGNFTSPAKSVVGQSPTTLTRSTIERKGPWEGPLHPPRRVSSGKAQRHSRDQLLKEKDPGRVL